MLLANFDTSTVRQSTRRSKKGKTYTVRTYNRKKRKRKNTLRNVALGTVATLGLSAVAFTAIKARYRGNIKSSAAWALKESSKVKVPDLSAAELNRPNINFTVGGLWYNEATRNSTQLASLVEKRVKGHTVPINTDSWNKLAKEAPDNPLQVVYDLKITNARSLFKNGYNPTARELAANVYAYQKKYPDKVMSLFGHSSGGTTTNEAMLILQGMGADMSKLRQVTYGANNYGVLPSAPNSLHLVDRNDIQAQPFTFPNTTFVNPKKKKTGKTIGDRLIEDHGAYHYASSEEANKLVKDFVIPKDYTPPKPVVTKNPSKKVISNNSEDSVKEELRLVREARAKLRQQKASLQKAESNTKIPPDKREQALKGAKNKVDNAEQQYQVAKRKINQKIAKLRESKRNS